MANKISKIAGWNGNKERFYFHLFWKCITCDNKNLNVIAARWIKGSFPHLDAAL